MAISTTSDLQKTFEQVAALGDKAKSSDGVLVIYGYEDKHLLFKQFPWPVGTTAGEIESYGPAGMKMVQPQHPEMYQQGPVSIYETVKGAADEVLIGLLNSGAVFDGEVIQGTLEKPIRRKRIHKAFIKVDPGERDWENTSQLLVLSGTIHYHHFAGLDD